MFEVDTKYKIELNGFAEQDKPYCCPECNEELGARDIIGFGEYPKGGFRAMMKPNKTVGAGFECPKCFTKSCFHTDEQVYKMFLDYQNLKYK